MQIYAKSRGVSKGYSWLELDKSQKEILDPPDLKEAIQIVDSDDFSIVLRRLGGKLSLLITGLESQNRTDNRTRKIRNSVLWVTDESQEEEKKLRAIAIQALGGELAPKVDGAVSSTNNNVGFQVDFGELTFEKLSEPLSQGQAANSPFKTGNLSELKDELIEKLKQRSLPKKEGILLVVSPTVSKATLERNKVWLGFSYDVDAQDGWIKTYDTGADSSLEKDSQTPTFIDQVKRLPQKLSKTFPKRSSKQRQWANMIAAFLLGLIVATLGHLSLEADQQQRIEEQQETIEKQQETIENQTKEIHQLNEQVEKLNKNVNDLRMEIETKKQEIEAYQKFEGESYKSLNALKANMEKLCGSFQNECQQFQKNLERFQKDLQDQLNALKNKSDSSEDKAS